MNCYSNLYHSIGLPFGMEHETRTMSGVILNAAELNSYSGKNARNKVNIPNDGYISESESETEIEIESDSSSDNNNKFRQKIKYQSNEMMASNKNICVPNDRPNIDQSTSQHSNSDIKSPSIGNVTVQNSSQTMFGNKTIYNAPVTINNFVSDRIKCSETENISSKYKRKSTKRKTIVCVVIVIAVMCSLIIALKFLSASENNESPSSPIFDSLRLVTRDEWTALRPKNVVKLDMPAYRVIIGHTVTPNCFEESSCVSQMQSIQRYHMFTLNCSDIGYNFVVGGDGAVYVGRGWDIRGEHTYGYNAGSIGIAIVGSFNERMPPKHQLDTTQKLITSGVKLKKLRENFNLYGQRQLMATESPGHELYKIIMKWKNWKKKTEPD